MFYCGASQAARESSFCRRGRARGTGRRAVAESGLVTVTLPASLRSIGDEAFRLSSLTSLTLPEGFETIGTCAFCNASKLETVDLGGTVTIKGSAFESSGSKLSVNHRPERGKPEDGAGGPRDLLIPDQRGHGLENEDAHGGHAHRQGGHEGQGRADLLGSIQGQARHQVDGGRVEAYLGQGHDDREDAGRLGDDTGSLGAQHARQDDGECEAQDRRGGRSDESNDAPAREGTPGLICLTHD